MAVPARVTGAWMQLLSDWLDAEQLAAPSLRLVLDSRRPAEPVPLALWQQLLAQAVTLAPRQVAPTLHIGAGAQPRHAGLLGYLSLASATLAEALLAYQRYEQLLYGERLVVVRQQDEQLWLTWPASASTGSLADTVAISALWRMLQRLLPEARLSQVSFVHAAPATAEIKAAEDYFGCPVSYAAQETAVVLPLALLNRQLPHSDPAMRQMLDRQAKTLLHTLPGGDAFDRALQQGMLRRLPDGDLTLAVLAEDLHLSVRSLQRRLQARGLNWRQLLDRTRQQLARQYLADPTLQLGEVALLLGFSEQSAFNRACRRWTGTTPARLRRSEAT